MQQFSHPRLGRSFRYPRLSPPTWRDGLTGPESVPTVSRPAQRCTYWVPPFTRTRTNHRRLHSIQKDTELTSMDVWPLLPSDVICCLEKKNYNLRHRAASLDVCFGSFAAHCRPCAFSFSPEFSGFTLGPLFAAKPNPQFQIKTNYGGSRIGLDCPTFNWNS